MVDTILQTLNDFETRLKKLEEQQNNNNFSNQIIDFEPVYSPEELQPLAVTTPKERSRRDEFIARHHDCKGGRIYYEVHPTSVGSVIYIICDKCNTKQDITDYASW
jgi:hypothetical protein